MGLLTWVLGLASVLFVMMSSFALWVFWQLKEHQEILLYEYSPGVNHIEFGLALAIFLFAMFAAGFIWGWLVECDLI